MKRWITVVDSDNKDIRFRYEILLRYAQLTKQLQECHSKKEKKKLTNERQNAYLLVLDVLDAEDNDKEIL